jgi:hypothetical protein
MEITTVLPIRPLVIMSQQAGAAVSQPGCGRRSAWVVLARVEHRTLHYQARTGRETRAVTVSFAAGPGITLVRIEGALAGAAAAFATAFHQRIHTADPGAICTRAGAGAHAR